MNETIIVFYKFLFVFSWMYLQIVSSYYKKCLLLKIICYISKVVLDKLISFTGRNNISQKRNDSFQFTKHVSTYSCHLQLQMSFFNGCTFEFML